MSAQRVSVYADTSAEAVRDSLFYALIDEGKDPGDVPMWAMYAAVRGDSYISEDYLDRYYDNLISRYEENGWEAENGRYTEFSKLILMMTAMGKDARSIEGHNLLEYLADLDLVKQQGINGVIYALIAVNCRDEYEIPIVDGVSTQNSEEVMVDFMLENEADAGGWRIMGGYADVDVTAMALQALAPYYDSDERVREKADRAVNWLSENQQDNGGYMALLGNARVESVESTSQVVLALTSLGIDPCNDERFIASSGKTMVDRMYDHYISDDDSTNGFAHILPAEGEPEINTLATVEGYCAVTSLYRFANGMSAFYDLRDVDFDGENVGDADVAAESAEKDTLGKDDDVNEVEKEEIEEVDNVDNIEDVDDLEKIDEAEMRSRERRSLVIFLLVSAAAGVTVYILRTGKTTGKRDGKNGDEGHKKDSK